MSHYLIFAIIVLAAGTMAFARVWAQGYRPKLRRQEISRTPR